MIRSTRLMSIGYYSGGAVLWLQLATVLRPVYIQRIRRTVATMLTIAAKHLSVFS